MVARAATDDVDTIDEVQLLSREAQLIDHDLLIREAPRERIAHHAWLLMDLFEHEIRVATALSHIDIPVDMRNFWFDLFAEAVVIGNALRRSKSELIVLKDDHITRGTHERHDIGCHIASRAIAANNDRRILARDDHLPWLIRADDRNTIGARKKRRGFLYRFEQIAPIEIFHQVRNHFSIGIGREDMPFQYKIFTQFVEVLDDAIVNHGDIVRAARVGVRSLGAPCVAQRVWPMPHVPKQSSAPSAATSSATLPCLRTTSISLPLNTAMPAES